MKTIKITIYELLGLIKDGKAPKKIKIEGQYFIWFEGSYRTDNFEKEYMSAYFRLENMLNDEIEILEEVEEDKFEDIEEIKHKYIYGLNAKEEMIDDRITEFEDTINSLIKNQKKIIEQLKNKD